MFVVRSLIKRFVSSYVDYVLVHAVKGLLFKKI